MVHRPNAQTPAYEWALSDPNPPIGAWAALRIFQIERNEKGFGDLPFLRSAMRKLILEYGWWANRNDRSGDNVFEGGFLGLDNIGVFDRRYPCPMAAALSSAMAPPGWRPSASTCCR